MSFIYTEVVKVILSHFVPYITGMAKMTVVVSVKEPLVGYTFDYTLGEAIMLTSESGDDILPRAQLGKFNVSRLHTRNSSKGVLLAVTLRMYLKSCVTPMRLVSNSVNVMSKYNEIVGMNI